MTKEPLRAMDVSYKLYKKRALSVTPAQPSPVI